jgi:transcriptional regulator with GAF, ATPase, and Fis domain
MDGSSEGASPDGFVSRSTSLQEALGRIERVAPTNATVLITGETGTGKELVARAIHRRSQRANHQLVAVNVGAIPESLLSSELFGHEHGAFTGAVQRRIGRFEQADRGTIFLDEAGELSNEMQVALLRVLQEGEFERLGSSQTRRVDLRVIAATNRLLEDDVEEGRFRADLYYRLSVFPINLPPLRERAEDIPALVHHFLRQTQRKLGRHRSSGCRRIAGPATSVSSRTSWNRARSSATSRCSTSPRRFSTSGTPPNRRRRGSGRCSRTTSAG